MFGTKQTDPTPIPYPGETEDEFMDRLMDIVLEEERQIDRHNYWKALWWLIRGKSMPDNLANRTNVSDPEYWTWKDRIALIGIMLFGKRGYPSKRSRERSRESREVLILKYSDLYGDRFSLGVIYWPKKFRWDFDSDRDSYK